MAVGIAIAGLVAGPAQRAEAGHGHAHGLAIGGLVVGGGAASNAAADRRDQSLLGLGVQQAGPQVETRQNLIG
jgi:hypothetical protein